MNGIFERKLTVLTSMCDSTAKMSHWSAFSLFMDLATEHANELGVGSDKLGEKGLIWVASKTKAVFIGRPAFMSKITATTWPEEPQRIRFNRHYTIRDENGILIKGKTEWAIIDKQSGKPQKGDGVYPQELNYYDNLAVEEPFSRITADFENAELIDSYRVKSTDIDLYGHMNNVAYIRAFMETLSTVELKKTDIASLEISYRIPCFEGDILRLYRKNADDGIEIVMINSDNKCAAALRVTF